MIVNADDFGLCDGVNAGIAEAHTKGVLTSATLMAGMGAAEKAVEIARGLPDLGVGVHLTLTEGPAVSTDPCVKTLLDSEGLLHLSPVKLALRSTAFPGVRNAIRAELTAQVQWVLDHGIKPTHLDSHKHVHAFPTIFSIVSQIARKFGIPAIRRPLEPKAVSQNPWPVPSLGGANRARTVRIMAKINQLQNSDFFDNDVLLGIAHTGKIDVNFFKAVALFDSSKTVEVMTHPGYIDGLDPDKTRLFKQREFELQALCSEQTKQYLHDANIKLVNYGQL